MLWGAPGRTLSLSCAKGRSGMSTHTSRSALGSSCLGLAACTGNFLQSGIAVANADC